MAVGDDPFLYRERVLADTERARRNRAEGRRKHPWLADVPRRAPDYVPRPARGATDQEVVEAYARAILAEKPYLWGQHEYLFGSGMTEPPTPFHKW